MADPADTLTIGGWGDVPSLLTGLVYPPAPQLVNVPGETLSLNGQEDLCSFFVPTELEVYGGALQGTRGQVISGTCDITAFAADGGTVTFSFDVGDMTPAETSLLTAAYPVVAEILGFSPGDFFL